MVGDGAEAEHTGVLVAAVLGDVAAVEGPFFAERKGDDFGGACAEDVVEFGGKVVPKVVSGEVMSETDRGRRITRTLMFRC
jgi:hypothetical protein